MVPAPAIAAALCLWMCVLAVVAPAPAAAQAPNSADRMIMWIGCGEVVTFTDAELDMWKSRGVDGFVCMTKQLWTMGGSQSFTGDPSATLNASKYELQRTLRDTAIVARARARGMKLYLGVKLVNYYNSATPLREWFDDSGWANQALSNMGNLAAAARLLGFAGLAFDQELYAQRDGVRTATWNWNYPGNVRSEAEVRAKARQRGQELMTRIVANFPGAELIAYDVELPSTWGELVQRELYGNVDAYARRLDINFWDGLSSVPGYGAIRLVDATFTKSPHFGSWDNAFHYNANSIYSYLSRRMSNWAYASTRLHVSPFGWIDAGPKPSPFDDARPVAHVSKQLMAFRKWGTGGEWANYAHRALRSFDYSPYAAAMAAASAPAVVDTQAPSLAVSDPPAVPTNAASTALGGTANDNLAVRVVRWASDRGHSGVAQLTWRIAGGDPRAGYTGEMRWSIPDVRLEPGANRITITAEDIKGLTKSATVTVRPAGAGSTQKRSKVLPRRRSTAPARIEQLRAAAPRRAQGKKRLRARRRCLRRASARRASAKRRVVVRRCVKRAMRRR